MGRNQAKRKRRRASRLARREAARAAEINSARTEFVMQSKRLAQAEFNLDDVRDDFREAAIRAYTVGGMTQREMSEVSGRSQPAINRWVRRPG